MRVGRDLAPWKQEKKMRAILRLLNGYRARAVAFLASVRAKNEPYKQAPKLTNVRYLAIHVANTRVQSELTR